MWSRVCPVCLVSVRFVPGTYKVVTSIEAGITDHNLVMVDLMVVDGGGGDGSGHNTAVL